MTAIEPSRPSHPGKYRGLSRISATWMIALWIAALGWASWWTWQLWSTAGLFVAGPGFAFAFWLLPMLPLFAATSFWLHGRTGKRHVWPLCLVVCAAILFFALPFRLPREQWDATHSRIFAPASLYAFLAALSVLPIGITLISIGYVASSSGFRSAFRVRDV